MNDLAASIGLVQLKKLDEMNAYRSQIIRNYLDQIANLESIDPLVPFEPDNYVYQMFGIRVDDRDDMIVYLKSKGIATGCHYTPLSIQPLFKRWGLNCPYIEKQINRCITLPLHTGLTEEEVHYCCEALIQKIT